MACFYAGFRSTNEEPEENEEPISFIARGCIENNVNVNEVPRPGWLPTRRFMEDLSLGEVLTGFVSDSQEHRGHQSSGARAPELWCPHMFFRGFLDDDLRFMLAVFR